MAHFVLSTHMTNGDVLPFLRLAAALVRRGHRATLVTHGAFGPLAARAGVEFRAIDRPEDYTDVMKDLYLIEDPLNRPDDYERYQRKYYAEPRFRKEYELLVSLCREDPENTALVCKERDGFVAMIVSEQLGIPIAAGILAPSYVSQLRIWEILGLDFAISQVNRFRTSLGLPPVGNWVSWMSAVRLNIGFWHPLFAEPEPDWPLDVVPVGFPLADEAEYEPLPDDLLEFVRAGEPPLLVTGGTGKMLKPHFYDACIEACERLERRTILVTRHEEYVRRELPPFIRWYRVLPLAGVYPLVQAVVHHGGIGTITGAMAAGVPQLALAADSDRPDNGMRIRRLGIGEYLPPLEWRPERVVRALEKILSEPVRARCRQVAETMRAHDTMAAACAAVESIVGRKEYAIRVREPAAAAGSGHGDALRSASRAGAVGSRAGEPGVAVSGARGDAADASSRSLAATAAARSLSADRRAMLAARILEKRRAHVGTAERGDG